MRFSYWTPNGLSWDDTRSAAQSCFAVTVVRSPFVGIAKHVVGFRDLLELLFSLTRTIVAVRVICHRELAVCFFYLVVRGSPLNAEGNVVIGHRAAIPVGR